MNAEHLHLGLWGIAAAAVSSGMLPVTRRLAFRLGVVASPRDDRWHRKATPLLGGVALAIPSLGLALAGGHYAALAAPLAAGFAMFVVGVADDILTLKPATKLVAQIGMASLVVLSGARLHWTVSMTLDTVLTLVWLVGLTNAFNLLDNMDGLCAGVAVVAIATLLVGSVTASGVSPTAVYLAILLGSTLAFLARNVNPASIFMGDAGSLFLGSSIASLALLPETQSLDRSNVLSVVVAPVMVVAIPIADTALVTISRLVSGRKVSHGGRDHVSHRLVVIGLSERAAVGVLWGLSVGAASIAMFARSLSAGWAGLIVSSFVLAMVVFAVYLAQVRVYHDSEQRLPSGITPIVVDFMHKRRVAEVLLDFCLVTLSYFAAWRLRVDGPEWGFYFRRFLESLPLVVAMQLSSFFVVGAYRGLWRHFGLMDGVVFTKGVLLGTVASVAGIVAGYRFENYPRSVFVIYPALLLLLMVSSRSSFRLMDEFVRRRRLGHRLVIYGAGEAGALAAQKLLSDPHKSYRLLGYVDDDSRKQRLNLGGYPVLGTEQVLLRILDEGAVDVVVMSLPHMEEAQLRRIQQACRARQVALMRFGFQLDVLDTGGSTHAVKPT